MRLLADEDFPFGAVLALRGAGHDVFAVATEMATSTDEQVLSEARRSDRLVLTSLRGG